MNHINEIHKFKQALNKYRLTNTIPDEIQSYSLVSKKKVFKRVMKTLGKYSLLSGFTISIYFLLKKIGLSTLASKIIIALTVTASLSTATYYTVRFIVHDKEKPVRIEITPSVIAHSGINNWVTLSVTGVFTNNSQKDLKDEVVFLENPTKLATVKNINGSLILVFNKEGKGLLTVQWKKIEKTIHISYIKGQTTESSAHIKKIIMKDGIVFLGTVEDNGQKIILKATTGSITLEKSMIARIEPNPQAISTKKNVTILPFRSSTFDNNTLVELTGLVKNLANQIQTNEAFKIEGQIDKIGQEIYVSMKLINLNTHKLISIKSKNVTAFDEVKKTCALFTHSFINDFLVKE